MAVSVVREFPELAALTFHRSVDRTLLHRRALSEVFLTDCRRIDANRYAAGAQLPPSHGYYTDHLSRTRLIDPLLLLECCRQAETYGGHALYGVPADTNFILLDWSLQVPDIEALAAGSGPVELAIAVTTHGARRIAGALRRLTYQMAMAIDGRNIGDAHISVGYLPSDRYQLLRCQRRGSPPASSSNLQLRTSGAPVSAHLVARSDPRNVLLIDREVTADGLSAQVRPAVDNPSMFDHAQDHLPGMVLTEAARQASLLALHDLHGVAPAQCVLSALRGTFHAYAELDAPVLVHIGAITSVAPTVGAERSWQLQAQFRQSGDLLAELTLTVAQTEAAGTEVSAHAQLAPSPTISA